tara:strand:+ start:543 stop:1262 length:720 start_codon:yes stop_codon:yes gene_type:complete
MKLIALSELAKETALKAGNFLLSQKLEPKKVESESGRDIKLELDIKTEQLIRKELKASNISVQGEELSSSAFEKLRWVVDPIDGTANYFRGLDQCCVSIALMDMDECLIGVIYNFNTNELYEATKGHGAKLNNRPITVSSITEKNKASLTTGFPASETVDSSYDFLDELKGWKKIRMFGSAALSCAYVASGKCDFYAEKGVFLWDFAAGIILVKEAGGKVEFLKLDNERYSVKISNGKL